MTNVNNNAPVLNVVEDTSAFHITALTFTGTDLNTGDIVFSDTLSTGQGNRTGKQDALTTCTAPPQTFVDEETGHTIEVTATAVGFFAPLGVSGNFLQRHLSDRGLAAPALSLLALIHPSAWKVNSQKLVT